MLRKHINSDSVPVDVKSRAAEVGPTSCPQDGCQSSTGSGPYQKGCVVYEEYGGGSGDYVTSKPCKCCDGKGYLAAEERAYETYCVAHGVRDLKTGYPDPHPMSREVYESPRVLAAVRSKAERRGTSSTNSNSSGGCFIATAVYGSYDAPQVKVLRRFRDDKLLTTSLGRLLVNIYYRVSPAIAARLHELPTVTHLARKALDAIVRRVA